MNKQPKQLMKTARITGVCYLFLAITGVLGFMVFHSQIFVSGNPEETLNNLISLKSTARIRLLFEFGIVVSQALTAVYFYKLFKGIDHWAAWTLGIWGIINSVVIMVSAIAMASCIGIANTSTTAFEAELVLIQLLQNLIGDAWGVGGLFFGLWLFLMGYLVIQSKTMPIWLGRALLLGGVGYLISTVFRYMAIDFVYNRFLTLPATLGEFWMIGYLLIFGFQSFPKSQ